MATIINPKKINEIVAKLFIKTLPVISGYPYYKYLNEMIQALYVNATTVPTTRLFRKYGHVSLIMKYTLYSPLTEVTPWVDPM